MVEQVIIEINDMYEEDLGREEHISLERRMGHLERNLAVHSAELVRNTEMLEEIRAHLNKPTDWANWIMATVAVLGTVGGLMYGLWVAPLEVRMDVISEKATENRAHLKDIGDYAKETRAVLDTHLDGHVSTPDHD